MQSMEFSKAKDENNKSAVNTIPININFSHCGLHDNFREVIFIDFCEGPFGYGKLTLRSIERILKISKVLQHDGVRHTKASQ